MGNEWPSLEANKDRKPPFAWIQWKGTNVCMDIHCACGELLHLDAEFAYYIQCGECGQVYECSGYIDLHPIDVMPEGTWRVRADD